MAQCPACKTEEVYNSGFSIECVNTSCRFFSQTHRDACLGKPADFLTFNQVSRRVSASSPQEIDSVRLSCSTAPISVEVCYTGNGSAFSFARWQAEEDLELRVGGNAFWASIEVTENNAEHDVEIVFVSESGEILYEMSVSFSPKDKKFEVIA